MPDTPTRDGMIVRTLRLTERHLALVAITGLVGLVLGLAFGLTRPTVHEAETRLVVGTFDAPADAVPGYVLAAQTVAQDYARLAGTPQVIGPLAERLGVEPGEDVGTVSVVAIPGSAILRVVATSGDEDEARDLAEGMSQVIQDTVTSLNAPANSGDLLERYTAAATDQAIAQARVDQAKVPGSPQAADLNAANVALAEATLRASTLAAQYQASQQASSTSGQVRTLGGAVVHQQSKALATLVGSVVGLVLGLGVGLLLALGRDRASRHHLAVVEPHPASDVNADADAAAGGEPEEPDEPDGVAS